MFCLLRLCENFHAIAHCTILVDNGEDDVRLLAANYRSIVWSSLLENNLRVDDGEDDNDGGDDDTP